MGSAYALSDLETILADHAEAHDDDEVRAECGITFGMVRDAVTLAALRRSAPAEIAALMAKAEEQVAYWRERQRAEKCLEDCVSEDGDSYTPIGDGAAWQGGYCNGRMSEADWWLKTIRAVAPEVSGVEAPLRRALTRIRDFAGSSIIVRNDALDLIHVLASAALAGRLYADASDQPPASSCKPLTGEAQGAWRSQATDDVLAERRRQVEAEGWTPEHDDGHISGQMAAAAACYAAADRVQYAYLLRGRRDSRFTSIFDQLWPWDRKWWKPTGRRRDLVKSAALVIAEIERLDRLPASPRPEQD